MARRSAISRARDRARGWSAVRRRCAHATNSTRERERRQHRDQRRVRRVLRDPRLQLGADGEPRDSCSVSGYARSRSAAIVVSSACAAACVTPGLQASLERAGSARRAPRANPPSDRLMRRGDIISGTKKSERTNWSMPGELGRRDADHGELDAVDPHACARARAGRTRTPAPTSSGRARRRRRGPAPDLLRA